MTDGSGQAPAGWYYDPHAPERMRYFDGELWTNHFHQPGKLPDIGRWLHTTFTVFGNYWQGAAVLAMAVNLVGSLVIWGGLWLVLDDVAVVDERFVNFGVSTGLYLALFIVFGILLQGFGWLAMSRFLHRAHFQNNPTVADAFEHALKRLPRYLGVMFGLLLAAFFSLLILAVVVVALPALGIVLVLVAIPLTVWVVVKLAFVINAIAIAPSDTSVIRASADVSNNRFWPVLGRLLLFWLLVGIVVNIATAILGGYGQLFDTEALSLNVQVRNDELFVRDFSLSDLRPSSGQFFIALILNGAIQAASGLVSTSAFVRLYLDSGAPSERLS